MNFIKIICITASILTIISSASAHENEKTPFALVIHGGAGAILKENISPEREKAYRAKLDEALRVGQAILGRGGSALDAVEATITVMEDSPIFNAGKGAVFSHEGRNEMDASLMEGHGLRAGAITGVSHVKNPISLAREVMENSPHVMLSGAGAEEFAVTRGIKLLNPEYFRTNHRWQQLQEALEEDQIKIDHNGQAKAKKSATLKYNREDPDHKFGTVGAVALDIHGNLAAGTSTGGMTNKRWNRIGDSPVIGAGTYADNASCAVSATGHGEFFIRATVARSICALVEYKALSLQAAANEIIMKKLVKMGGSGGIIALDPKGNIAMTFNTKGMFRGYITNHAPPVIKIYMDKMPE